MDYYISNTTKDAENKQKKVCVFVVYTKKHVCTYFGLTRTVNNVRPDELHGSEDPSLFGGQGLVCTTLWFRLYKS